MRYTYAITFDAAHIEEAEDFAAELHEHRAGRGRDALYYEDPISGKQALWAEPVMDSLDLVKRRERE